MHALRTFALTLLVAAAACKPVGQSVLADAATTSSFKTGFFMPKTPAEYSLRQSRWRPWDVTKFMNRFRALTNSPESVKLWKPADGTDYAVSVTGSGEQVLVTYSKQTEATPVLSITPDDKVWDWGPYVVTEGGKAAISELFVRRPYVKDNAAAIELNVENMFVRRQAMNADGDLEPVMVPWLAHVKSEVSDALAFRMGNTILDGRSGKPILEFVKISAGPAWAVLGIYRDADVKAGTAFWKSTDKDYYSLTPGQPDAVHWVKQDDDSLDRIGKVAADDVKKPADVEAYLASSGPRQAPKHAILGFDWLDGDDRSIQLERTDKTFGKAAAQNALALTGDVESKTEFTEEDYEPGFGLRTFSQWWAGEKATKPVQKVPGGPGYEGVAYTDQTGQSRAGAKLAERNDPNGNKVYTVLDRRTNEVRQVSGDGRVLGAPVSLNEYKTRAQGNIERTTAMRESGELAKADGQAIRDAQKLDARAKRQLEKSESLVPGSTVGEMAGGKLRKIGVAAVSAEVKEAVKKVSPHAAGTVGMGIDKALAGEAVRVVAKGAPDSSGRVASDSQAMLVDVAKEGLKNVNPVKAATDAAGAVTEQAAKDAKSSNSAIQSAAGVAIDTGLEAKKRYDAGDFSPDNPDVGFDSAVSGAGIAGTAANGALSTLMKGSLPEDMPVAAGAGAAIVEFEKTPTEATEALSRAVHAGTLSGQAGELLDQAIERRQVTGAYEDGLKTAQAIEGQEAPPAPAEPVAAEPAPAPVPAEPIPAQNEASL